MPEITFTCPQCRSTLAADTEHLGQAVMCPGCSGQVVIPVNILYPGIEIGGFVLERLLGKGGMGEVWLAHHSAMDRKVAFKTLSADFTHDPEFVDRFFREVKNSAKLEHPNIVTAFDAGHDRNFYYLAMTYVDGIDLDTRLARDKCIPEEKSLRIVRDIAMALDYAWSEHKLLHCDIKPSNIMIDGKGRVRLMDMGLSKCVTGDATLTMAGGGIMGTPLYISPEQARGVRDIDFRSDVYSLGATFYHIVTGHPPFHADTPMGIVTRHITDPLVPANTRNPSVSAPCSALIDIMMSKNPDDRGKSWKDVIKYIDAAIAGKLPRRQAVAKPASGSQAGARRSPDRIPVQTPKAYPVKSSGNQAGVFVAVAAVLAVASGIIAVIMLRSGPDRQIVQQPVETIKVSPSPVRPETPAPAVETVKPVQPAAPKPAAAAAAKQPKEIFEEAMEFAQSNPDNAEKTMETLREARKRLSGTSYESQVDQKIMEIVNAQLSNGMPAKPAADILKEKPKTDPVKVAAPAQDKEAERIKFNEFLDSIVLKLIDGKYEDALSDARKAADSKDYTGSEDALAKLQASLISLSGIDKLVLESFKDDVGKEIDIETVDGIRKLVIREVKDGSLAVTVKEGTITSKMDMPLKKLTENEKLKRTDSMDSEARNIYAGVLALRQGRDPAKAQELLMSTGTVSEAFARYLLKLQLEKADNEAKEEFLKLLAKAGLKGHSLNEDDIKAELNAKNCTQDKMDAVLASLADYNAEKDLIALLLGSGIRSKIAYPDKIKAEISQKKMTAGELEKLQKAVTEYRGKYRDTRFLKEKAKFLDTLLTDAGSSYGSQFEKPVMVAALNMIMVPVPAGEFKMGMPGVQAQVKITKPFWIGKYEVTQMQYEKIMSRNPSACKGFNMPVERVTWNDATEFCRLLTERDRKNKTLPEGYVYRLPTEAEWEYCCRAGTGTAFSFGDSADDLYKFGNYCDKSNTNKLAHQDRKHDDGSDKSAVVGKYQPNAWGICDMHGNVWEWCLDWYAESKAAALADPAGPESGSSRVNRGGAWDEPAEKCSSAYRGFDSPESSYDNMGFRIVLGGMDTAAKK